jgi:putative ATP-dependent endonuclease of the OLD family
MKIKSLTLKNFRAYKNQKIIFDEDLNVIVGQNDIGKSTVLEALDIFFGQEVIKIDITDWNKDRVSDEITIAIEFIVTDNLEILIDKENKTNLQEEYLLNENGYLEIHKVFKISNEKLGKENIFINANYLYNSGTPIISQKIAELRKNLIDLKIENVDKTKSAEIRKAIYSKYFELGNHLTMQLIEIAKEDTKKIWESLEKELPFYFLFQSDRANKDSDGDIQNPLKTATKKIVAEFEDDFKKIKDELEKKLVEIGNETIEKMKDMGLSVAESLTPKVNNKNLDTLFSFTLESDDGIPLNKRGSGFRRMITLNYFRVEAERKISEKTNKNVIYAIEEPETAQHPSHQQMLVTALIELSQKKNHQVVITTHTPEIAKIMKENNLIFISKDGKEPKIIENKEEKLKLISNTLGLHPYFNSKVIVCLEGQHDVNFIKNINQSIIEFKEIIDIEKENITLLPLTGGNLKQWVDKNYLENSNVLELHIYDSDNGSGRNAGQYKKQQKSINSRNDNSYCFITTKREMENYIHKNLIESKFSIDCSLITNWDEEDIPSFIQSQSSIKDENAIKGILNGQLSKKITKELLQELNAFDEIKSWFIKLNELNKL